MRSPHDSDPDEMPTISDAEWTVMRIVWKEQAISANGVVEALQPSVQWKPNTIHTLLRRLRDKGVVRYEKVGREFIYRPRLGERECQLAESRTFLDRVFGGGVAPLIASFVENENLSQEEIDRLQKLLDDARRRFE